MNHPKAAQAIEKAKEYAKTYRWQAHAARCLQMAFEQWKGKKVNKRIQATLDAVLLANPFPASMGVGSAWSSYHTTKESWHNHTRFNLRVFVRLDGPAGQEVGIRDIDCDPSANRDSLIAARLQSYLGLDAKADEIDNVDPLVIAKLYRSRDELEIQLSNVNKALGIFG